MSGTKIDIGPDGERVARNINAVRTAKGLTYKALSDMCAHLGRPIPPLGLRRVEAGERRVDIQDLITLCRALEIPAEKLLLAEVSVSREYVFS